MTTNQTPLEAFQTATAPILDTLETYMKSLHNGAYCEIQRAQLSLNSAIAGDVQNIIVQACGEFAFAAESLADSMEEPLRTRYLQAAKQVRLVGEKVKQGGMTTPKPTVIPPSKASHFLC